MIRLEFLMLYCLLLDAFLVVRISGTGMGGYDILLLFNSKDQLFIHGNIGCAWNDEL